MTSGGADERVRLTAWLHGRVQGVGMRWWIRSRAMQLGLAGWARNTDDGRVEVVAEGERGAAEQLLAALKADGSAAGGGGRPGHVTSVTERWAPSRGDVSGFVER